MRFRFYAVLHNMRMDNKKNKGKKVDFDEFQGRLTNSPKEFEKILSNPETNERIGFHSSNEYIDEESVYIYIDGKLDDINNFEEMDVRGLGFAFYLLRKAQYLTNYLWVVKDNSIYVRDGFLIAYPNNFNDVATYKSSLTTINTTSDVTQELISTFSDNEIEQAMLMQDEDLFGFGPEVETDSEDYMENKYPTPDLFMRSGGSTRYMRAFSFILIARGESVLPLKIVSYVNALECLFTTATSELTYRVSERAALLLGENYEKRKEIFNLIKESYKVRSTIVHGGALKGDNQKLIKISTSLDQIFREILVEHKDFFEQSTDKELDEKFEYLVFE